MIELNCSYEESKKILELGYDFTSICRDFELHEEEKITKFVLVERHDCGLVDLWDCDDQEARGYSPKSWWITPLIPKAALEACLPEHEEDGIWYVWLGYTRCMTQSPDECDTSSLEYFLPNPDINSAFEAFLWVHENYPKELKKKFDEVMG